MNLENVIKTYFNSAIVIDDELSMKDAFDITSRPRTLVLTDEQLDLEAIDEIAVALDTEATIETQTATRAVHKPHEVYKNLIKSGIVAYPFKYNSKHKSFRQLRAISEILVSSRILVVDWNMDQTLVTEQIGRATKEILRRFIENENGIKCAIIYTQEDRQNVLSSLGERYEIIDEHEGFFQNKTDENTAPSLLGFVIEKQLSPNEIFEKISRILLKSKSTTLHFMYCANLIDKKLHNTLKKYNEPFEKVIFTQLLTSDIPNNRISNFINNTIMTEILELSGEENEISFLFERKRINLLTLLPRLSDHHIEKLLSLLSIRGISKNFISVKFNNSAFIEELKIKLNIPYITLSDFSEEINNLCRRHTNEANEENFEGLVRNVILFITLLENYLQEICIDRKSEEDFKQSFKKQSTRFTKLLKYSTEEKGKNVQTGSIYTYGAEELLLCITPVCDTYRPKGVENNLKFLVGKKVANPTEKDLKNESTKFHISALPTGNSNIEYVKWSFYNVKTFEINQFLKKRNLKTIATMKKDYVQNISNRYIAYQSRAGVNELFYKESSYIGNFLELLK